jgi:hypothetical protein
MSTAGLSASAPAIAPKSLAARCVGVLLSPVTAFQEIVQAPGYIGPIVVLTLFSVAVTETMLNKIGMDFIIRRSIVQSGQSLTPEQIDQAVQRGASFGAIFAHLGGLLGVGVMVLVVAALGMLIANTIYGGEVKYGTSLAVAAYSYIPSVFASIIAVVMILFGDRESFNPNNLTPTNLGFFLDIHSVSKPLYTLATSLDVFSFWILGLLGIGFAAAIGKKTKPLSVFLPFLGLWAVWVLVRAGLAMLSS